MDGPMSRRRTLLDIARIGALCALAPAASLAEPGPDYHAYDLSAVYTGEMWRAASGGLATGSRYLDNLDLMLAVDAERAFGLPFTFFAHALYNNGHSISGDLVGDAQGVSSIEGYDAWRLFELWLEWRLGAASNHAVRYGLYDVNSEFDVTPTAGLFVGSSHGMGREFSQSGPHGPSTFPVTGLAVRYRWQVSDAWSFQAAAIEGVPGDPQKPKRTTVRLSQSEGALLIGELARESSRLTKAAVGVWHYTAEFDHMLADASGQPVRERKNSGAYVLADVALIGASERAEPGSAPRLSAFMRFGVANGDLNRFDQYLGAGLAARDIIAPGDELGLAVSQAQNGDAYRRLNAQLGADVESAETNVELTWRAPLNDWIAVQPTVQYVMNPNTDPALRDAWVLGLRFEVTAGRRW
jgi:porin